MSSKELLPTDWYYFTLRRAEDREHFLSIIFTIDRGEEAYRNIIERFPYNKKGMNRLKRRFAELGYEINTDYKSDSFIDQFTLTKIRFKGKVDRYIDGKVIRNKIIEFQPPDKPEEYNVRAPKTDEFFNQDNKGRDLPI